MKTVRILTILLLTQLTIPLVAQNIGINSSGALPDNSAGLDVSFSNKGLLIPRVALTGATDATTIASPTTSLMIYNTATAGTSPNNVTPGYYYWSGSSWIRFMNGTGNAWTTSGNSGTIDGVDFIGTTDNVSLGFKINNTVAGKLETNIKANSSLGYESLLNVSTGVGNTAFGVSTLRSNLSGHGNVANGIFSLAANTIGSYNNALGGFSLYNNTTGGGNVAVGYQALQSNTTGNSNVAIGNSAMAGTFSCTGNMNVAIGCIGLYGNTSGSSNVAIGYSSLYSNTIGSENIALGYSSLYYNVSGDNNVAMGHQSLNKNTTGSINIGIGSYALQNNTTGVGNVAICNGAAGNNTSGYYNIAIGNSAMAAGTSGDHNIAIGTSAFYNNVTGQSNTVLGSFAGSNSTGNNNTFLGTSADVTTAGINNSTAIGYNAKVSINNAIVLGTSSENIGIGISNPSTKLDVAGQIKISGGSPGAGKVLTSDATGLATWSTPNAGTVTSVGLSMPSVFSVSGSPVTSSGTLTASLATQTANTIFAGPSSGGAATPAFRALVAADIPTNLSGYIQNTTVGGNFTTGQSASFDITGNAEIGGTLEVSGNVGLGTTSPLAAVHATGEILSAPTTVTVGPSTGSGNVTVAGSGSSLNFWNRSVTDLSLGTTAGNRWAFYAQSGTARLWTGTTGDVLAATSAGNIGIGTATPTQKLHVVGNGLFTGTVTASCGTLVCSDQRYKTNITPLTNSLEAIQKLNGYNYFMKTDEFPQMNFSDKKQIGFIAQELEQVFPEMVYTDENGYKTVNYQAMTPVLLEAIKEQQNEINELKKLVEQLIQNQTK